MVRADLQELVRPGEGRISRKIFWDEDIYREELEKVWTKCWIYVGHESQIPEPGDYITHFIGEDPVVVSRDAEGKVGVFLNSCPHRGMMVCRADTGNTSYFRCPYHGWTFAGDGKLVGVPRFKTAYCGERRREDHGLIKVPQVTAYSGFIFACWDPHAPSLEDYLGDFRWYFDVILARHLGGIKVIGGIQRYRMNANWKAAAGNFTGDAYHALHAHASAFKLGMYEPIHSSLDSMGTYGVCFDNGHGLLDVPEFGAGFKEDLRFAQLLGDDVVDYVHALQKQLNDNVDPKQAELFRLGVANIFPQCSFNDYSALAPIGLYQWIPKGAAELEIWQGAAIDDAAPEVIKEIARTSFTRVQSVAGFFGQDDTENFDQVTQSTRGLMGQRYDFDYSMALGHELEVRDLPGRHISQKYSEENERNFYRKYLELMSSEV